MKKYLRRIPKELRELINIAGAIADSHQMPAYLVGGFVRDLILGVQNLDLDIVVEGDGIKFAEILSRKLKVKIIRHRRFGTATLMPKKHLKVDIATARREYYSAPAQLPEVSGGTLRDDLKRRDFTINAMAISINQRDFGRFVDFFNGREDLRRKKIRILHSLSFIDDPTRILRAIRFEQRYDFQIEPETLKLLREAVRLKMLEQVNPHRLRDELILILKEGHPLRILRRIKELTGFNFINPGLSLSRNTVTLLKSVSSQIKWFKQNYPKRRHLDTWLIYFIALVGPLDIKKIGLICKRFAFHRGEEKRILAYKKLKPKFSAELSHSKIKPSRVFSLLEPLSYEAIILIKAKFKNDNLKRQIEDFFKIYNGMRIYISGEDLRNLGLTPGPHYQKILQHVLNARLNGLVKTKKEELELIKKITAKHR